ncbi:hypothetical protein DSO57_1001147 [Entomophthora muscae]|uniref:Uncharacterized protein n=1 Tax=Entomophthora muscae TaxID=34485 RepID=A0ACC2S080_9FUNG|nr:hypothetical protein DSO57_1001147 [Entomophthora muscae]
MHFIIFTLAAIEASFIKQNSVSGVHDKTTKFGNVGSRGLGQQYTPQEVNRFQGQQYQGMMQGQQYPSQGMIQGQQYPSQGIIQGQQYAIPQYCIQYYTNMASSIPYPTNFNTSLPPGCPPISNN